MPIEVCPYCKEKVDVEYGRNVSCPKCGGLTNVIQNNSPISFSKGLKTGFALGSIPKGIREKSSRRGKNNSDSAHRYEGNSGDSSSNVGISYNDIGGLEDILFELDIIINGSRKYPELWRHLGRKKTRAVLISGPPGCGKTLMVQALANEAGKKVHFIQGSEIKGWKQGASEGNIINAYESVQPDGILVIDEIDSIGGKRDSMVNEINVSIVGTLCSVLDGAKYKDSVVILATTNRPHMIDNALRRPGRFELEINVPAPDANGRKRIFEIHTRNMPLASDVDLGILARRAHGFTGADISGVCANLSRRLLKQSIAYLRKGEDERKLIENLIIAQEDFNNIIEETIPSLLRENYMEISTIKWNDIGGLEDIKEELKRIIIWPLKYKKLMKDLNLRSPKGVLLEGPPGCGKTLLAKAIAGESEYNMLIVNGPSLVSKWMGSTEEAIRDLFYKARQASPCIIFLDEAESIAPVRGHSQGNDIMDRAVSQLLTEIDGAQTLTDVFVMAATNRADLMDPALLRPGRLDLLFEVPLPDAFARKKIFEIHLRNTSANQLDIDSLVEKTEDYSGAMIELVCVTAKKNAMENYIKGIRKELVVLQGDLEKSVEQINERH